MASIPLQPTPRAILVFAAGLVLAIVPAAGMPALWPLWLGFCALVIAACGLDAVFCPRARQVFLLPALPERLAMGRPTEALFHLALPVPWPVPAEATADLSPTLEPLGLLRLELAREPTVLKLPLVPRRRGAARIENLWLRFPGPLGLVRRTVRRPLDHPLAAVPDLGLVRATALSFDARDAFAGHKVERLPGEGSEFHALREFAPGLDARAIDWKASARHTRLVAREFRAERNHQVVFALDTGRLMAEPVDGTPLLDHAIHAALLLALVSLRAGDRVSLFAFAERPQLFTAPRGGLRSLPALVEHTSALAYGDVETNFTLGLTDLASRLHRRSLVIVLTDFVDALTAELMVENLLRLGRRHLLIFVAFRDPFLDAEVEREPRTAHDLDRAVVAEALVQEREVVQRRLTRAGMAVIDAPPRQVGPQLVERYLEIKRRERI